MASFPVRLPSSPSSPTFTEDLHRFPSESLHSFSFANQPEDYAHRPKRPAEVKKADSATPILVNGPLTGPAWVTGGNVFDKHFIPRPESPSGYSPSEATAEVPAETSSRTPTNPTVPAGQATQSNSTEALKRTCIDTEAVVLQHRLVDAMEQADNIAYPGAPQSAASSLGVPEPIMPASPAQAHITRWVPAAQAIFTTQSKPPWTILAANDLACLVFGVTNAEVRKMGILELVQEERRAWLERKLLRKDDEEAPKVSQPQPIAKVIGLRPGITAQLLSKPNSRLQSDSRQNSRRAQTVHGADLRPSSSSRLSNHHHSRGVLLCGDVVPIQKRNGATGSASIWVKEKKIGLIWVVEEIHEDVAFVAMNDEGIVSTVSGETGPIWGVRNISFGVDIGTLIPRVPRQAIGTRFGEIDFAEISKLKYFTCRNCDRINIPATLEQVRTKTELRVSSFPHIAGIMVVCPTTLRITKANAIFSGALFGRESPDGEPITTLIPDFENVLRILTEENGVHLVEGIVVPEQSFRKASAFIALRKGLPEGGMAFLHPDGLTAKHRDGSDLKVDIQMRVVRSEKQGSNTGEDYVGELMYALWITYSRHLHATRANPSAASALPSEVATPLRQPSPGQAPAPVPTDISDADESRLGGQKIGGKVQEKADEELKDDIKFVPSRIAPPSRVAAPRTKKAVSDFIILEDMGHGAYGQVKLARYKKNSDQKVVLKFVTKRRILVDTWTRDRKLGTVPLEIHVLNYLSKGEFKHPNIVEMADFFEDETNYYIEMIPHGLPGMDLFDYIELRGNMDENEARNIFVQCARAVHHLHNKALVVHRDIKDENVILDGEGHIKLIDFGSAAYIKSGPFNVFVGTIGRIFSHLHLPTSIFAPG